MSHIVRIATRVRDAVGVAAACRRLGLPEPVAGTARLYEGEVAGLLVMLPGWKYPAVIDTTAGTVAYDNFDGLWGDREHLGRFLQAYAVEKAKLEAARGGRSVVEETLTDGSIRLTVSGGGAA